MKRSILSLMAAALLLSGCMGTNAVSERTLPETEPPAAVSEALTEESGLPNDYIPRSGLIKCRFFDSESFLLWEGAAADYPSEGRIMCGTAPHHLTAGHMIAGLYSAAAKSRDDIETVVITATSHYAGEKFCTTLSGWDSPFGTVETNTDIVRELCEKLGAVCSDERMENDHSASSHIPFIKRYFPEAKTACLLAAPNSDSKTPQKIAETLAGLPGADKCLFIFSIDFSHYLDPERADDADEITRAAVADREFEKIERFTNDNVDSPICLSAYVRLSDLLGADISEADNSNTMKVNKTPYNEIAYPEGVTSYFVFLSVKNDDD